MLDVARFAAELPAMLDDAQALIECESPSADLRAVAQCAHLVAELGARRLAAAPHRDVVDGHPHLLWTFGPRTDVLLLGHLDTVWPLGSLREHPCRVSDGVLTGPGCFDMKTGLVQLFHAVAALPDRRGVTVLITSDEEIGSTRSRAVIEEYARGAQLALVLEASADGALKSARKGVSTFAVEITGRAAHAGLEPERGANAGIELAHQVLAIAGLGDAAQQTSVTPTVLAAGTTTNTVPDRARAEVDVRAFTVEEQRRVVAGLAALAPVLDGTSVAVRCEHERPPLPRSASEAPLALARRVAEQLGLPPLRDVAVGGGSDGNITAGVGTPTLDGLGAVGGGAHAADEHVLVAEIAPRTALLAGLVAAAMDSSDPTQDPGSFVRSGR